MDMLRASCTVLVGPRADSTARTAPLDGFRALAVTWVLVTHTFFFLTMAMPPNLPPHEDAAADASARWLALYMSAWMRGPNNGSLGVDIFFLLSGFLIMMILERELAAAAPTGGKVNDEGADVTTATAANRQQQSKSVVRATAGFFLRRYLRIMPAYAVALAVFYLAMALSGDAELQRQGALCVPGVWKNVLFMQNFWPLESMCMSWSWSIAVEFQMYLLSPAIVLATLRWPARAFVLLSLLALASFALFAGLDIVLYVRYLDGEPMVFGVDYANAVYTPFYTRMFAYVFGMMVALQVGRDTTAAATHLDDEESLALLLAKPTTTATATATMWLHAHRWLWPLRIASTVVATVIAVGTAFPDPQVVSAPDGWILTQQIITRPAFALSLAYVMYDIITPAAVHVDGYQAFARRWLSSRPLYVLAQLSYSVYLLHLTLIFVHYRLVFAPLVTSGELPYDPRWMFPVFSLYFFVLSALAAVPLFLFVERPFMVLGARLLR